MDNRFDYNGPLYQWVDTHNEIKEGVEVNFGGKYYFKIEERLYYIGLRCSAGNLRSLSFCRLFTHFKTGEDFFEDLLGHFLHEGILNGNPAAKDREYTTQEFRIACERFVEEFAVRYNEQIKTLESGRFLIYDDYWDKMNISSFDTPQKYMSWEFIDNCGKYFKNERFQITAQTCPRCGSPIIKSKYCTSAESWKNLAGREGWIWFCPECKEQIQDRITAMN